MQSKNGGFSIPGSPKKCYISRSQGRTRLLIEPPIGGLCSFSFAQIELLSIARFYVILSTLMIYYFSTFVRGLSSKLIKD
jgi:hypothetical protein